jgi:glycosyltransferase involved in cell wall biosynthesis
MAVKLLFLGTWSHGGFGRVTAELGERFLARGIDLRIIAVDYRGEPLSGPLAGRVWPAELLGGSHGANTATAISGAFWQRFDRSDTWKPDAVLAIEDMTGLLARMGGEYGAEWQSLPVYHYCPIEGDNLVPDWRAVWNLVQPIAMSDYGARVIGAHIGRAVPRIYHGVDTETFRPVSIRDPLIVDGKRLGTKEACKAHFGMDPRRNVILRSDSLVQRKFYDKFLAAMIPVLEQSPDTDVIIHTVPINREQDMIQELKRLPEWAIGRIKLTGIHDTFRGLSSEGLAALTNAADLYVSTTGGEGFGLNLAEALACEVPVVVTDWAADAEVVGPGGILVPPLHDSYGEPVRFHSIYGMDWAMPDPRAFVEPILSLLRKPSRRRALGQAGREHVLRSFSWDTCADQFIARLEESDASIAV